MNTKLTSLFAIVLCFAAITPASASFTGAYDVSNWTISNPLGGSVNITDAPNSITLTSSDTYSNSTSDVAFTITAAATGNVSFDWSYQTSDEAATFDPFGYLLNNVFHLISPLDQLTSSGTVTFAVVADDVFGFDAMSFDSSYGPAVTTVSNFNGPVPTAVPAPAALWLMGLGLAAIGFRRRQAA